MKLFRTLATASAIILCAFGALSAHAQVPATPVPAAMMTEKKVFSMPSYTTFGGKTIKNVKVRYETYGTLNAKGDNAIFIAHFYSGNSHAAGKYKPGDAAAGYWDSIIGAGKPIDTDKFFVISADTLSNLNTKDPNVTTTGPSSINADTGKPYGMSFPVIAMRDSVVVHKALVDSLGVKKLYAFAGASGGSVQAVEWTVLYPDFVDRAIPVISPGLSITPWAVALLDIWVAPIKADPKWNNGDYYETGEPLEGIALALKLVTITTRDLEDQFIRARFHRGHLEAVLALLALAGVLEVHERKIFAHKIRMHDSRVHRAIVQNPYLQLCAINSSRGGQATLFAQHRQALRQRRETQGHQAQGSSQQKLFHTVRLHEKMKLPCVRHCNPIRV